VAHQLWQVVHAQQVCLSCCKSSVAMAQWCAVQLQHVELCDLGHAAAAAVQLCHVGARRAGVHHLWHIEQAMHAGQWGLVA
jgi:hypothetical protein